MLQKRSSSKAAGMLIQLTKSMLDLNAEKARIFRITHIENVPWILENGLHCCNSKCQDPNFCVIGNTELIDKRTKRMVPIPPRGTLSDYIPFYFTPYSPMLYNIKTGFKGLKKTPMPDIAILVTSLHKVCEAEVKFVFTDRHAYVMNAKYCNDLQDLNCIDWGPLNRRDFSHDSEDPDKVTRYMAEALIYQHLPVSALLKIVCHGEKQKTKLQKDAKRLEAQTPIAVKPDWYF